MKPLVAIMVLAASCWEVSPTILKLSVRSLSVTFPPGTFEKRPTLSTFEETCVPLCLKLITVNSCCAAVLLTWCVLMCLLTRDTMLPVIINWRKFTGSMHEKTYYLWLHWKEYLPTLLTLFRRQHSVHIKLPTFVKPKSS